LISNKKCFFVLGIYLQKHAENMLGQAKSNVSSLDQQRGGRRDAF
jgi:hypothetical protein